MADNGIQPSDGIKYNPQTNQIAVQSGDSWQIYGRDKYKINSATGQVAVGDDASGWKIYTAPQSMIGSAASGNANNFGDDALHQLGMTARTTLKGLSAVPMAIGDAVNTGINYGIKGVNSATGTEIPTLPIPSQVASQTLDANFGKPKNATERIVDTAGQALTGVAPVAGIAASTASRALAPLTENLGSQAAGAIGSGAAQQTVHEAAPGHPFLEFLANLAGGAAGATGVAAAGTRYGQDAARVARLNAFNDSGIPASAPDVTQSTPMQLARNSAVAVPLAAGVVKRNEVARLGSAQRSAEGLAQMYGGAGTPEVTGNQVQNAVERYRYADAPAGMTDTQIMRSPTSDSSIAAKANVLYNRVPVPADTPIAIPQTMTTLGNILGRFNNPELAAERADPTIQRWQALLTNSGGELSWNDLRQLRTDVRYLRSNPTLSATVDDRALSQLNDALTQDMVTGANTAGGPRAAQLVSRADQFYGRSMDRVNQNLQSVFKAPTPESAYGQIESALLDGKRGDMGKLTALRRALTDDEWGDVGATVLNRLGNPVPSNANVPAVTGTTTGFSPSTFMTNYMKMSPNARNILFDGAGRGDLRGALDQLATAVGSMKGTEQMANSSKSALVGGAMATGAGLATAPISTGGMLLLANLGAKALYNPTFVRLMTRTITAPTPQYRAAMAQNLLNYAANNPSDPEFLDDAKKVAKAAAGLGALGAAKVYEHYSAP